MVIIVFVVAIALASVVLGGGVIFCEMLEELKNE